LSSLKGWSNFWTNCLEVGAAALVENGKLLENND
jgi:hypothetical protein